MTDLFVSLRSLGRPFWWLWLGVSISSLGAQLMQFALGVWVYQRTGSVLDFAGIIVAGLVPRLLVLPIAGNLVDRLNRRFVIIVSDCAVALMSASPAWDSLIQSLLIVCWRLWAVVPAVWVQAVRLLSGSARRLRRSAEAS
jgi:MFS family permease